MAANEVDIMNVWQSRLRGEDGAARMEIVRRVRAGAFHMRVPSLLVIMVAALMLAACEQEQPVAAEVPQPEINCRHAHAYAHRRQCRRTDRDCHACVDANACAYRNTHA